MKPPKEGDQWLHYYKTRHEGGQCIIMCTQPTIDFEDCPQDTDIDDWNDSCYDDGSQRSGRDVLEERAEDRQSKEHYTTYTWTKHIHCSGYKHYVHASGMEADSYHIVIVRTKGFHKEGSKCYQNV